MNHDTMRERLALDLYGELDAAEKAELDSHLTTCDGCRRYAVDLSESLGSLQRDVPACELPPGWVERLRREVEGVPPTPARPHALPLLAAAAGFAACALVVAALGWGPRSGAEPVTAAHDFGRVTPPPAAQTLGVVGRWGGRR